MAESGLTSSVRQLVALGDELERERSNVESELEQIALDRLVRGTSDARAESEIECESRLQARQDELTNLLARVTGLQQRVTDFDHLMASALQQFVVDNHLPGLEEFQELNQRQDRKSTRLNSSHVRISYAVF